ncbi:MAG: beta-ketoacyl synthase N-terminal-like domain-containing protein, partial [Desulfobulbales bacterium]
MNNRVVITGIGCVHASGVGNTAFFQALEAGHCLKRPLPETFHSTYRFRTSHYIPLPEFSLQDHGIKNIFERAMQPEDRMTLLAARIALRDGNVEL